MNNATLIIQSPDTNLIMKIIKYFFFLLLCNLTFKKIINVKDVKKIDYMVMTLIIVILAVIVSFFEDFYDNTFATMIQILGIVMINKLIFKKQSGYTVINTIIAISINDIIYYIAILISFIPMVIFNITNDYINLGILIFVYIILLYKFLRIRKIKNGIIFLQKKLENEYFNLLIINISALVLFTINIISEYRDVFTAKIMLILTVLMVIMYITIKKSLELYYKQNLLIQELKESKEENEKLKEDNARLEEENLSFNKKSHTLAHKQKSLERKIRILMQNSEIAEEIDISDQVKELSQELYQEPQDVELEKTGIENIDDMLGCMQEECIKNNIEFELKIYGNIYQMTNNCVTKDELEILIADHVKDAIIAINHSDNINRSILVRIGKIDGIYSLYIYDSGIEFEPETFKKLGKEPITTHADSGGTGLGFMNTFDTLKKNKASLIIKEYNKPCKENYTKVIIIKFDDKSEFKVDSYRKKILNLDIEEKADGKNLSIEKEKADEQNLSIENEKEDLELSHVGDKKALEVSCEGRNGKNE